MPRAKKETVNFEPGPNDIASSAKFEITVVTLEELLTVEGHPILGRIERWRMSDGTVERFENWAVEKFEEHGD